MAPRLLAVAAAAGWRVGGGGNDPAMDAGSDRGGGERAKAHARTPTNAAACALAGAGLILAAGYFKNESAQRINASIITSTIGGVNRQSAAGRIRFISRDVDGHGRRGARLQARWRHRPRHADPREAQLGADFRLIGRIASTDQIAAARA